MIRSVFLRNPITKTVLKKELDYKCIRFVTCICRPPRKKLVIRPGRLSLLETLSPQKNVNIRPYSDYPTHYKIALPALSPTMEAGTIIRWEKKEGDKLYEGDLLAEIETDKATMGFETPEEGYLAKIIMPAGSKDVPIGKLVCIIVPNEDDIAAFKNFVDTGTSTTTSPSSPKPPPVDVTPPPVPPQPSSPIPPRPVTTSASSSTKPFQKTLSSPFAKKIAGEQGISLESATGRSGIFGSIKATDLQKAVQSAKSTPKDGDNKQYEDLPLTNIRNVIAKRLVESKQAIPHYYLSLDINVDNILTVKRKINAIHENENLKLSVNDFVIKAMALACKKVPEANSSWRETFIRQYNTVDVSVAVSTDTGLITPIIFDADTKGLNAISTEMKTLAAKARAGKLKPHEFQGGTISLSNLGMFGITNFSAIINPPQTCILAVGATEKRLLPDEESEKKFKVSEFMSVTLSCDHRTLDGAVGAKWLSVFRSYLENPDLMLL